MNFWTRRMPFVGLVACFVGLAPLLRAQEEKGKGAATSEEAVKRVFASLKDGKLPEALPHIAAPENGLWAKYLEAAKAVEAYSDALDAKFGADPAFRKKLDLVEEMRDHGVVEVHEVKSVGKDRAQLIIWKKRDSPGLLERKIDAVKTEMGWKLHLPSPKLTTAKREVRTGPDGKELVVWVEMDEAAGLAKQLLDLLVVEAAKQSRAVKAGNYKSRREAFEEFQKSYREQEEKLAPKPPPKPKQKG
jgi:hypothetical protein